MSWNVKLIVVLLLSLALVKSSLSQGCDTSGINCISCTEYRTCIAGSPQGKLVSCKSGGSCADDSLKQCQIKLNCYALNECTQNGIFPDAMNDSKYFVCLSDGSAGFLKYEFSCPDGQYFDQSMNCVPRDVTATDPGDSQLSTTPYEFTSTDSSDTSTTSPDSSTTTSPGSSTTTSLDSSTTTTSPDSSTTTSPGSSTTTSPDSSTTTSPGSSTTTSPDSSTTTSPGSSTTTSPDSSTTTTSPDSSTTTSPGSSTTTSPDSSTTTSPGSSTTTSPDSSTTTSPGSSTTTSPDSSTTTSPDTSTTTTSSSTTPSPDTPTTTSPSTPTLTPPFVCPGPGIFPDPDNCKIYYRCSTSLKSFYYICPGQSYFNENFLKCSLKISPACQEQILRNSTSTTPPVGTTTATTTPKPTTTTFTTTMTTPRPTTTASTTTTTTLKPTTATTTTTTPTTTPFSCPMPGTFENPLNCKTYYRCSTSGKVFRYICPGASYFNEITKRCSLTVTARCRKLMQG